MNKRRVLVIEDHPDCRELLRIVLTRAGYIVDQAGSGLEAMQRAGAARPDVIVMDYGLPDLLGDTIIKVIKTDRSTKDVPVIVSTGFMTAEVTRRAIAAGAASVLIKPYDVDRLLVLIERCLPQAGEPASPGVPQSGELTLG
jgi:CheY-like chemotaxis protein